MRFEWFVARRYLRSPNRPAVLRLVTAFSVLGVTAGVATLVIALAMNTGFREALQDRLLGVTAHIALTRPGSGGIHDYEALATKLSQIPGVRSVTPAVYQTVLMTFAGESRGVVAKGIDPVREEAADEALHKLSSGKLDFQPDADGIEAMLVGKQLADDWKLAPGDYLTLTSPQGRLTPFGLLPRTRRFRVAGIFDSGFYDYDANWCFVKMDAAQALAGASDVVNVLEFRLQTPETAPAVAREIDQPGGYGLRDRDLDGAAASAVPSAAAGKTGHRHFHRAHNAGGRLKYPSGPLDDRNRPGKRHRRPAFDGFAFAPTAQYFPAAGIFRRRNRHNFGIGAGIFVRVCGGKIPAYPARSAGVCRTLCAFSSECDGRSVDFRSRDGNFASCDPGSGPRCGKVTARRNPSF